MTIDQIEGLFKTHDWYYDRSDDMRVWYKGHHEKQVIIDASRRHTLDEIFKLLEKYCPNDELKLQWKTDLIRRR